MVINVNNNSTPLTEIDTITAAKGSANMGTSNQTGDAITGTKYGSFAPLAGEGQAQTPEEIIANSPAVQKAISSITDFDIRELMKLLIAAFSELKTADRERALNVLNATVSALETKIAAMETAKKEAYDAAIANAVGSIVSGALSVGTSLAGGICSLKGLKEIKTQAAHFSGDGNKITKEAISAAGIMSNKYSIIGQTLSGSAQGVGQMVSGGAGVASAIYSANKAEAEIEQTKADALLEILRQAQDQYNKGSDSLQQFIDKVLNIMQQLLQSAAQTEKSVTNI